MLHNNSPDVETEELSYTEFSFIPFSLLLYHIICMIFNKSIFKIIQKKKLRI